MCISLSLCVWMGERDICVIYSFVYMELDAVVLIHLIRISFFGHIYAYALQLSYFFGATHDNRESCMYFNYSLFYELYPHSS